VIKVFDVIGKVVRTFVDENKAPGEQQVIFDASGLPAGVYFYQLQADGLVETKKMVAGQ